jgi:hypothetical protein
MTVWQGVGLFLITFAATVAGGLVVVYRERLATLALRCVLGGCRLLRSPCSAAWTRFQRALVRPVADRLGALDERLDSLESILRSVQDRVGIGGPGEHRGPARDQPEEETDKHD